MYMSLGTIFTAASWAGNAVRSSHPVASSGGSNDVGAASGPVSAPVSQSAEGPLMQGMMQTLGQMGLGNSPAASGGGASELGSSGGVSGGFGADSRQAMHALMHDLFQVMQAQAGTGDGKRPVGKAGGHPGGHYGEFSNSLQSVVDGLKSTGGAVASNSSALGKLQTDFNSLMQSLGVSGPGGNAGAPSLQTFLQGLEKNMAQQGTLPRAVGNSFFATA